MSPQLLAEACDTIISVSLEKGSDDNMTAIAVSLKCFDAVVSEVGQSVGRKIVFDE